MTHETKFTGLRFIKRVNELKGNSGSNRLPSILFAIFVYALTSILILFGVAALAKGDEYNYLKRAKIELTPSVGLQADFNASSTKIAPQLEQVETSTDVVAIEQVETHVKDIDKETKPKSETIPITKPQSNALESPDALAQIDSLCDSETFKDANAVIKERILKLASEIEVAIIKDEKTILSFIDVENEKGSIGVTQEELELLDQDLLGEGQDKEFLEEDANEEIVSEEDEDEGFAFAYSNPKLPAPSLPASDFSTLGLQEKLGLPTAVVSPVVKFQPVPYPSTPVQQMNEQRSPATPAIVAPLANMPAQIQQVPLQLNATNPPQQLPLPALANPALTSNQPKRQTANAYAPTKIASVPTNSLRAPQPNYVNDKTGNVPHRFLNGLAPSVPSNNSGKGFNLSAPNRLQNRFSSNDHGVAQIRQVAYTVQASSYDEEYEDDENLPIVSWKSAESSEDLENLEDEISEEYEDDEQEYEEETERTSLEKPIRTNSVPSIERNAVPLRQNNVHSQETTENNNFLRPFKRMRERRALSAKAPAPPEIESFEVEDRVNVEMAKEPLLTRENANLPPLGSEINMRYSENASAEDDAPIVRSDLEAIREEMKTFSWTKGPLKITPYGFLTLSVSSDSQRSVTGDFYLYSLSEEVDSSSAFSIDARTSRIGLKIEGPRIEELGADLGGCAEFDFQGYPNGSKNKGGVQLRRAYAELVDKKRDRRLLAGQDWEIISPGAPQMLNYLPAGFAGDLQYRRAQLRYEQGFAMSSNARFLAQIAACDNVLDSYAANSGVSVSSSGWPVIEGRLSVDLFKEANHGRAVVLGVSGHIGEQYYKFSPLTGVPTCSTAKQNAIKTWSTNFDFEVPIGEIHKIHGEYYVGSNLSTFIGGINQGVDLYKREGIDDKGGWLAWHSDWSKKVATNIGYGYDRPDREDLVGTSVASNGFTTSRTRNEVYFVNCLYNWTANFMTGVELGYWRTDWQKANITGEKPIFQDMKPGKNTRIEFTTRLFF